MLLLKCFQFLTLAASTTPTYNTSRSFHIFFFNSQKQFSRDTLWLQWNPPSTVVHRTSHLHKSSAFWFRYTFIYLYYYYCWTCIKKVIRSLFLKSVFPDSQICLLHVWSRTQPEEDPSCWRWLSRCQFLSNTKWKHLASLLSTFYLSFYVHFDSEFIYVFVSSLNDQRYKFVIYIARDMGACWRQGDMTEYKGLN